MAEMVPPPDMACPRSEWVTLPPAFTGARSAQTVQTGPMTSTSRRICEGADLRTGSIGMPTWTVRQSADEGEALRPVPRSRTQPS